MPNYQYACDCGAAFEEGRSIKKGPRKRCPACKKGEPSFHQVYTGGLMGHAGGVKTLGQLAEANTKKMGKELAARKAEEAMAPSRKQRALRLPKGAKRLQPSSEKPWWRSGEVPGFPSSERPLDVAKLPDVKRYIREGR